MIQKYMNNIGYLHKRVTTDNEPVWDQDSTPFYCNRETVKVSAWNPQGNISSGTLDEVIKTTTQLNFEINDKITFFSQPLNDVNSGDASLITSIEPKPIMEMGNKHRSVQYYEYWITIA